MPVAALDGQGNADGDAPGEADSDGVGYLSYDESASDTEWHTDRSIWNRRKPEALYR